MPRLSAVWVGLLGVCLTGGGLAAVPVRAGGAGSHGILFAHGRPGSGLGGDLYVWSSGSRPRWLTASPDPKSWPRWSPSGKRIAFQMVPGWNGRGSCGPCADEILVMRPDGSDQLQLTNDADKGGGVTTAVEPSWSPDGSRIVFTREFADRGNELVVISVRSRRERVFRALNGNDPVWGPRGVAYVYRGGGGTDGTAIRLLDPKTDRSKVFRLDAGRSHRRWRLGAGLVAERQRARRAGGGFRASDLHLLGLRPADREVQATCPWARRVRCDLVARRNASTSHPRKPPGWSVLEALSGRPERKALAAPATRSVVSTHKLALNPRRRRQRRAGGYSRSLAQARVLRLTTE